MTINNIVIGAKNAQLKTFCVAVGLKGISEYIAIAMVRRKTPKVGVGELERKPQRRKRHNPKTSPATALRKVASD